MFEISIQKNIKDYKGKVALGFTWRQIIALGLALLVNVPFYFYFRKYIPETLMGYVIMFIAVLFFGIGFFDKDGMPLEQYIYYVYESTFKLSRKRHFSSQTLEECLIEEEYQNKLKRLQEINNILDGKK